MKPTPYEKARQALADNLNAVIKSVDGTVNGEAASRKIPQRTLENLTEVAVNPRLETIANISHAFGLEPWQALCPLPRDLRAAALEWLHLYSVGNDTVRSAMDLALEVARKNAAEGGEKSGGTG